MAAHAVTPHNRPFDLALRWTTLFYLGVMVVLPMVTLERAGRQARFPAVLACAG